MSQNHPEAKLDNKHVDQILTAKLFLFKKHCREFINELGNYATLCNKLTATDFPFHLQNYAGYRGGGYGGAAEARNADTDLFNFNNCGTLAAVLYKVRTWRQQWFLFHDVHCCSQLEKVYGEKVFFILAINLFSLDSIWTHA
jgi:hypothetical protein